MRKIRFYDIFHSHRRPKVLVIGLDAASPELVFDRFSNDLPCLTQLRQRGMWGKLKSTIPPITIPAWTSMTTGCEPGQLGIYGFRSRRAYNYSPLSLVDSTDVRVKRVWDYLGKAGLKSILVGIPQTYPVKRVNGIMISGLLTPSTDSPYTFPPELRYEIDSTVGQYVIDVDQFRTENKNGLLQNIFDMTKKRFHLIKYLIAKKPWDFFMFVEIGPDRMHHGFWKYCDPHHRFYQSGNSYENSIRNYYQYLDFEIGELLSLVDNQTIIIVVSDHGALRMEGGIGINEWLVQQGYLVLRQNPGKSAPLDQCNIDWSRTLAWAEGGYYARVFLNVKGREPQGMIDPENYEKVRSELAEKISAIPDDHGKPLPTRVFKPQDVYREIRGIPPDLIVYFGGLHWRSIGRVGTGKIHFFENDTGPDNANHSEYGIFLLYDPRKPGNGRELQGREILDIAPTILQSFGIKPPRHMIGKSLI